METAAMCYRVSHPRSKRWAASADGREVQLRLCAQRAAAGHSKVAATGLHTLSLAVTQARHEAIQIKHTKTQCVFELHCLSAPTL
jgi:hypothetical protein